MARRILSCALSRDALSRWGSRRARRRIQGTRALCDSRAVRGRSGGCLRRRPGNRRRATGFRHDGLAQLRVRPAGHTRAQTAGCWSSTAATSSGKTLCPAIWITEEVGRPARSGPPIAMRQVAGQKPPLTQHFRAAPRRAEIARKHARPVQGQLSGLAAGFPFAGSRIAASKPGRGRPTASGCSAASPIFMIGSPTSMIP